MRNLQQEKARQRNRETDTNGRCARALTMQSHFACFWHIRLAGCITYVHRIQKNYSICTHKCSRSIVCVCASCARVHRDDRPAMAGCTSTCEPTLALAIIFMHKHTNVQSMTMLRYYCWTIAVVLHSQQPQWQHHRPNQIVYVSYRLVKNVLINEWRLYYIYYLALWRLGFVLFVTNCFFPVDVTCLFESGLVMRCATDSLHLFAYEIIFVQNLFVYV